jgi:hypothetical protein
MGARAFSFPHPVLGPGDDVAGELSPLGLTVTPHGDQIVLSAGPLSATNPTILTLIRQGLAEYAIRVHCAATYFRRTWTSSTPAMLIRIPANRLIGTVRVRLRVMANASLPAYRPEGLHLDYGETAFPLERGDILAEGEEVAFSADKDFDPLAGAVSSFMRVECSEKDTGPFETLFDHPRILIRLPKLDWANYQLLKGSAPQILHSAIVLPVLVEAIQLVWEGRDELRDLGWFQKVELMLSAVGAQNGEPLVGTAQRLLQNPFSRTGQDAAKLIQEDE